MVTARRLALVGVVALLALLVPLNMPGAYADVDAPPRPVSIPKPLQGVVTKGWKYGGAHPVVRVLRVGHGAYSGTCWVLGVLAHDPEGCAAGADALLDMAFGPDGDDRSTITGAGQTVLNPYGYAGYGKPFNVMLGSSGSGNRYWRIFYDHVSDGLGSADPEPRDCYTGIWVNIGGYPAVHTVVLGNGTRAADESAMKAAFGGTSSASSLTCGSMGTDSGAYNRFSGIIEYTVNSQGPDIINKSWQADGGVGTPWEMTYSRECVKGGSVVGTIVRTVTFVPTGDGPVPVPPEMPTCAATYPGSHQRELAVSGGREDATGDPEVTIHVPTYTQEAADQYPLCTSKAPSQGCWLDLQREGKSCFSGAYCAGWMEKDHTATWSMRCSWGPYAVPMSMCEEEYGTTFDGQVQPKPSASTSPSAGPSAGPIPTVGANPETPPQGNPSGDPQGSGCWGSGWSWNPISWVYVPTKCVLTWAFVPSSPPSFGDIPSPLPPGWVPTFPALTDGACGALTMPSLDLGNLIPATGAHTILNTCNAPWPLVRGFTYYGLLAGALVTVGNRGFRAVMTALGMSVDTPSSGGGDE